MGKIKEIYMQIMQTSDKFENDMTIEDLVRIGKNKLYEQEQYEREQNKSRLQHSQSKNSRKTSEIE